MSSPKKKLPTGPIRIEHPAYSFKDSTPESSLIEARKQDSSKQVSFLQEADAQEGLYGTTQRGIQAENHDEVKQKHDSGKQASGALEGSMQEQVDGSTWLDFHAKENKANQKQASVRHESDVLQVECKKVAMRLSETAVDRLRSFRATTGLPYEILVDVLICNLDRLPSEIQQNFLSQIKQLRLQRLVSGQNKGLETAKQKLSALE